MNVLARWVDAAKPASWPKLLVPFVLGQAIGLAAGEPPSLLAALVGLAFTVCDLLFIVFLNDWADRDVDALKRRMFPATSAKTIPDRRLAAHLVLAAGVLAGALALGVAILGQRWLDRPLLIPLAALSLAIFGAYSLPPVRLNYRGGGEVLEMLGVGLTLPLLSAYLQGGAAATPGLWLLPGFVLLSGASAVASGLSDERSDRRGGKRTVASLAGNTVARRLAEALALAGGVAWLAAALADTGPPFFVAAPAAAVALFHVGELWTKSRDAGTDRFAAQQRYKAALHRAVWRGALVAAILLAGWSLATTR